jgi:tetratricopeptide (TPR) repeat protein
MQPRKTNICRAEIKGYRKIVRQKLENIILNDYIYIKSALLLYVRKANKEESRYKETMKDNIKNPVISLVKFGCALSIVLVTACTYFQKGDKVEKQPVKIPKEIVSRTASGSYLAGLYAKQQSDIIAASNFYKQALKYDPDNEALLRNTYALLTAEGHIREAAKYARMIIAKNSSRTLPAIISAVQYISEEKYEKARADLMPLDASGFNEFLVPLLMAWVDVGQENYDSAIARLKENKSAFSETLLNFHMGLIYDLADNKEQATKYYKKITAKPEEMSVRALQIICNFYDRNGEHEKSVELVKKYGEQNPDSNVAIWMLERSGKVYSQTRVVKGIKEGVAEVLFSMAASFQGRGNGMAMIFSWLTLHLDHDFDLAQLLLGTIYESQEAYGKAKDVYAMISENSPVYFPTQVRIAENLSRLGDTKAAVAKLKQIAAIKPDAPDIMMELGDLFRIEERYEEALDAYLSALDKIVPSDASNWVVYYSLGVTLERLDRWSEAEAYFIKALEIEPNHPLVLNYLGYSWLEKGMHIKEAFSMIGRAVAQRPADGFIVDSLGWAYYMTGKYESAVQSLEHAVELNPGSSVINDHLGDAYWKVNRKREAGYQWKRALQIDADDELSEEDVKRIERKILVGLEEDNSKVKKQ